MRGKRKNLPTTHAGMEEMLLKCLKRLKEGKPNHPELASLAKLKKLKANATTLAKEAGVSRTLFSYDGCAYPKVRAELLQLKNPATGRRDMRVINADLRNQVAQLKQEKNALRTENAALIIRMATMDKKYQQQYDELKRGLLRGSRDPNEVPVLQWSADVHPLRPQKE